MMPAVSEQGDPPVTVNLAISGHQVGGTEKRLGNLFTRMRGDPRFRPRLYLSRGLHQALVQQGILAADGQGITLLADLPPRAFTSRISQTRAGNRLLSLFWARGLGRRTNPEEILHLSGPIFHGEPLLQRRNLVLEAQDTSGRSIARYPMLRLARGFPPWFHCASDSVRSLYLQGITRARSAADRLVVNPCSFIKMPPPSPVEKHADQIAFVGRLSPIKNPLLLLEALGKLKRRGRHFRARFIGKGELEGRLAERVARLKLSDRVTIGFSHEPFTLLAASQIFTSLQSVDNYHSQALMEAMACECAVVASDVGETRRIVPDGIGQRVSLEPQAVADALEAYLSDPSRARSDGRAAKQYLIENHSIERYLDFLYAFYQRVLTESGR